MLAPVCVYMLWLSVVLLLNSHQTTVYRIYPFSTILLGMSTFVSYLLYTFVAVTFLTHRFVYTTYTTYSTYTTTSILYTLILLLAVCIPLFLIRTSLTVPFERRDMELYRVCLSQLSSGGLVQAVHSYVLHSHNIYVAMNHVEGMGKDTFHFEATISFNDSSSLFLKGVATSVDRIDVFQVCGSGEFSEIKYVSQVCVKGGDIIITV